MQSLNWALPAKCQPRKIKAMQNLPKRCDKLVTEKSWGGRPGNSRRVPQNALFSNGLEKSYSFVKLAPVNT
jgi:hypothetical protein